MRQKSVNRYLFINKIAETASFVFKKITRSLVFNIFSAHSFAGIGSDRRILGSRH